MTTEYQVRQGKRKVFVIGAGFSNKHDAIEYLLKKQLEGLRNMYIVKLVPYGASSNLQQVVNV